MAIAAVHNLRTTVARGSNHRWTVRLGRMGLASRALLYAIVAVLVVRLAFGHYETEADSHGALRAVAREPLGRVLLVIAMAGMVAYVVWRWVQALAAHSLPRKASSVGKGLVYVGLLWFSLQLLLSHESEHQRDDSDLTERLLGWPAGRWIVGGIGAALCANGIANIVRGITARHNKRMKLYEMSDTEQQWFHRIALVGLVGRGVVFGLVGTFVIRAAVRFRSDEPDGLDETLRRVAAASYGRSVLLAVATGLMAYAVYVAAQARYRDTRQT